MHACLPFLKKIALLMFEQARHIPKRNWLCVVFFLFSSSIWEKHIKSAPERVPLLTKKLLCKSFRERSSWEGVQTWPLGQFPLKGTESACRNACQLIMSLRLKDKGIPYMAMRLYNPQKGGLLPHTQS